MEYDEDDEYGDEGGYDEPQSYGGGSSDLHPCSNCGRSFNPSSIAKHENICRKLAAKTKKRGVFDASKKRIQSIGLNPAVVAVAQQKNEQALAKAEAKTAQWRQKHEQFVRTIREARMVQNVLKEGGSLADLPPPPRDEHPEYVQCPHCSRRFDEAVAQRHIPFCATQAKRLPKKAGAAAADAASQKRTAYKAPLPGQRTTSQSGDSISSLRSASSVPTTATTTPARGIGARTIGSNARPASASSSASAPTAPTASGRPPPTGTTRTHAPTSVVPSSASSTASYGRPPPTAVRASPAPQAHPSRKDPQPPSMVSTNSGVKRASSVVGNNYDDYASRYEPDAHIESIPRPTVFRTGNPCPVERIGSSGSNSGSGLGRSSLDATPRFCGNCGTSFPCRTANYCSECGCKFSERAKFCGECGARRPTV